MSAIYSDIASSETVSLLNGAPEVEITSTPSSSLPSLQLPASGINRSSSAHRNRSQQRITLITKRRKMSRRANLIGICGVSGLCILLLIATAQHRPLPASMAGSAAAAAGSGGGGGSIAGGTIMEHHRDLPLNMALQQTVVQTYNLTATIADVLAEQRAKIAVEMENFEYPSGRFGVDADKLSDMTPETGGAPVRSIVITSWRSGSTFLGDILNAMPGNFYHYEPLLNFGIKQIRDDEEAAQAIENLKNLLYCDFTDMAEYLEYGKTHTYLFEHNERLWSVCKDFPHFCWRAKFLTPFCKLFPMQSMKTVRLRLTLAELLLEDKG